MKYSQWYLNENENIISYIKPKFTTRPTQNRNFKKHQDFLSHHPAPHNYKFKFRTIERRRSAENWRRFVPRKLPVKVTDGRKGRSPKNGGKNFPHFAENNRKVSTLRRPVSLNNAARNLKSLVAPTRREMFEKRTEK